MKEREEELDFLEGLKRSLNSKDGLINLLPLEQPVLGEAINC